MHISGENFQQLADVYLGLEVDFAFNPVIMKQPEKHIVLTNILSAYNNPPLIFVYSHRINLLCEKLKYFCNPFTLISHNSDMNIEECNQDVQTILACPLLKRWWAQNLCFIHPKMHFLPIGIANTMWEHGNPEYYVHNSNVNKLYSIHNNFSLHTNYAERRECADAIESRASALPMVTAKENAERLAKYKYCVCPEGNGVDTHRLWEALYLDCIPIVKNTAFSRVVNHYTHGELGLCIVDSWWDFELDNKKTGAAKKWLSLEYYEQMITMTNYTDRKEK